MRIALSISHARWWPHRSGYEIARPSWRPDEYGFSRHVCLLLRQRLADDGHEAQVFEKDMQRRCNGSCGGGQCPRYAAAQVNVCGDIARWKPDLAVEWHLNNGVPGNHGCFALCSDAAAEQWARAWLQHYTAHTPMQLFGDGVWTGAAAVRKRWGRKWFLEHAAPSAAIVECGFVSHATDAAFLQTSHATAACVEAAAHAAAEVCSV